MRLESRKYLFAIQHAGALLKEFNAGRTFTDYERKPGSSATINYPASSLAPVTYHRHAMLPYQPVQLSHAVVDGLPQGC